MSTIQIATIHASRISNHKIMHAPSRSKYYTHPPPHELTNYYFACQNKRRKLRSHHYRQWDALDCCYSFQSRPCCRRMICSAALPHHRSITFSHKSFRRCRTDELLQLVIQLLLQDRRSNTKHNIGECSFHLPSHFFRLIEMVPVHHRQSIYPGKHLCLLITTVVLLHPDVIQTYLSHRDTINSLHTPFQIFILPVRDSRI